MMASIFVGIIGLGALILFLTFRQWIRLRIDKKKQAKADLLDKLA